MSNPNLMNQVLFNKLDDDLNAAIKDAGGDVSMARGPWDYPEIIRHQLGPKFDIVLGPGLTVTESNGKKYLSANSSATTTGALNPPTGSYKQPTSDVIEAGTSIQSVFETLFYKILPKISSVYKGDIIIADDEGKDQYNDEDIKSGLQPNSVYLRLYVANSQEPVYILLSGHGLVNGDDITAYIGGSTEYVDVTISGNTISASLNQAGVDKLKDIDNINSTVKLLDGRMDVIDAKLDIIEPKIVTKEEVNNLIQNEVTNVFNSEASEEVISNVMVDLVQNNESMVYQTINNNITEQVTEQVTIDDMDDDEVMSFVDEIFS